MIKREGEGRNLILYHKLREIMFITLFKHFILMAE